MTAPDLLALARKGDLDALLDRIYADVDPESDDPETHAADVLALKWLTVASDLGHAEAEDHIADLYEGSSLRYDDDQFASGEVHLELGVTYLRGSDGFAQDLELGQTHLEQADECGYPASIEGGRELLAQLRASLTGDARAIFDEVYPPS